MPDNNDATATPILPTVATDVPVSDASAPNAPEVSVPNIPTPSVPEPNVPVADVVTDGSAPADTNSGVDVKNAFGGNDDILAEVAHKISDSHNVLIALSSDPSVDEMAAAIGLSMFLDKLGKRATAIYSGSTPNALEFLKPDETFEPSVDTLQDFVIALNQEKADHIRYKLDGDFVKIYVTPYKSKIAEEDLDFSYGDYNVDLVLALDVANGVDLDTALREHGRIMHDAVIINITTGNPGKLGEIEWSDKSASSVSEMIANLLYKANSKVKIDKDEATAFLTGIVAATNRFSNAVTTPETMSIASKLMESGANQQLVSKNITPDIENEMVNMGGLGSLDSMKSEKNETDPTKLDIKHDKEKAEKPVEKEEPKEEKIEADKPEPILNEEPEEVTEPKEEKNEDQQNIEEPAETNTSSLLDDLKEAEAGLMTAGTETVPEEKEEPLEVSSTEVETPQDVAKEMTDAIEAGVDINATSPVDAPAVEQTSDLATDASTELAEKPEKVIQPTGNLEDLSSSSEVETNKYGQMLEAALEGVNDEPASIISTPVAEQNPAVSGAPEVPANPEINGVPEINYMPMPGDAVLPPPPTPPINMDEPVPAAPVAPVEPATPAMPDVVNVPTAESTNTEEAAQTQTPAPANDPGAFKIPGM